ncbi:MAG: ABC transporter permease, partial [Burkholderiaceae bacterium]
MAAAIPVTLVFGAALGAVNGILSGYFRLRAFLTTLITWIIYRASYELLTADYATAIAGGLPDSEAWDFLGYGEWLGIPVVVYVYAVVALMGHILLTRLRPGWHITAIGGSRRSAYNTGIAVRRTVAMCYV